MSQDNSPILVSACLVGLKTRWNAESAADQRVVDLLDGRPFVPICPEQLGGLCTPRARADINGKDGLEVLNGKASVIDEHGADVTANFLRGALEAFKIASITGAKKAYLKDESPSCGTYTVSTKAGKIKGLGVTAALLSKEGVEVEGF